MKNKAFLLVVLFIVIDSYKLTAQTEISSISPSINQLNITLDTEIKVKLKYTFDNYEIEGLNLFSIRGTNSGIVHGTILTDIVSNEVVFKPDRKFFPGEIIYVGFGPLIDKNSDTIKAVHWQFTTEVPHKTDAQFDSLKKINIYTKSSLLIDLDKDGKLDILSKDGMIYFNKGNSEFKGVKIPGVSNIFFIDDFNNDGKLDLICQDENSIYKYNIYFGISDTTFAMGQTIQATTFQYGRVIGLGDINGDNYNDIIAIEENYSDSTSIIKVYPNDGKGQFSTNYEIARLKNCLIYNVSVTDIDMDGKNDLIFAMDKEPDIYNPNLAIQIYKNIDYKNFHLFKSIYNGDLVQREGLFVQDYDGDGYLDISVQRFWGSTYYYDRDSIYLSTIYSKWGAAETPAIANQGDFNGDGFFDIVESNIISVPVMDGTEPIELAIWLSNGKNFDFKFGRTIALKKDYPISGAPLVGDIDNDGDVDVINTGDPTYIAYNSQKTSAVDGETNIPDQFFFYQNYPNPFNPTTTIEYTIPHSGVVRIALFNVLGQKIEEVVNEYQNVGYHKRNLSFSRLPSGVYFCRLFFNEKCKIIKLIYSK